MAQVIWTRRALTHLRGIVDDSAVRFSPARAEKLAARVFAVAELLERLPHIGSVVPEYGREYLRERYVKPFRVLYAVHGDVCAIVGVIHSHRDLSAAFNPDDLGQTPGEPNGS
jgi:plasmid stabilization system protein ParE